MNTNCSSTTLVRVLSEGTRDAVETAIDYAKDDHPWKRGSGSRIARWMRPGASDSDSEDAFPEDDVIEAAPAYVLQDRS
ncbi:MAG: hypothetical protein JSR82_23905 [Verrucomicrobia bacterium]|nr:hypothetical protein [Verrucomicrobiota bacterium]